MKVQSLNSVRLPHGFIAAFVLTVGATVFVESIPGLADDALSQLNTSSGLLAVREEMGSDCGPNTTFAEKCVKLYLKDKPLLTSDDYIVIKKAFPSEANPKLVSIFVHSGGNECCSTNYMLDFTTTPPLLIKALMGWGVSATKTGVVFQHFSGESNALGDELVQTYSYKFGSGRIDTLHTIPAYTTVTLRNGKLALTRQMPHDPDDPDSLAQSVDYPSNVLSDPEMRGPILRIVGQRYFAKFRQSMSGASIDMPLKAVDNQFIVGEGTEWHGDHVAMFVIDVTNKLGWAAEGEVHNFWSTDEHQLPSARVWGVLAPGDAVPIREITRWLSEEKIPRARVTFAPPPDKISSLYRKPRIQAPPTASLTNRTLPKSAASPPQRIGDTTVGITRLASAFQVPVTINNVLTLPFVIDSGSTDVVMTADVVATLIRAGTIADADFLGKQTYQLADGSKLPSRQFVIHSLRVGNHLVENVTGTIAPIEGSLLLGQSFLGRFESWSIDNQKGVLTLK